MNNYKSFSELKEELGNNYDFKLYEMGISALKETENLQQENKQLQQQCKQQKEVIDKAIEYIEEKYDYILGDDTFLDHDERIDRKQINHIIEILKGSDKE